MPEGISFRRADASDLSAIIELRIEFERITRDSGSLDEDSRRAELATLFGADLTEGRLLCWLAEDGNRAIAQAALRVRPGGTGELLNVYTDPAFRGRGIGSALVGLAIKEARALKLSRITLQPTEDSRRIYVRSGFRIEGRRMILNIEAIP
jgi:ribosomal protein S18 acetylase RimI-like enzyme